jgi:phage shock protein C
MSTDRLTRSRSKRWIWGVCGGLENYFNLSAAVWRTLFIVGSIFIAIIPGIIIYIIMTIVIPKGDDYKYNDYL